MLKQYAEDPEVPITLDRATGEFYVQLAPALRKRLFYCFSCGGGSCANKPERCQCHELDRWASITKSAARSKSAARFDKRLCEYYLQYGSDRLHFYHCPACGGALPKSKPDGVLYLEQDPEEMEAINRRLMGLTAIDQIVSVLGPPDRRIERSATDVKDETIYKVTPIKETMLYTRFRTFHLCIQQTVAGHTTISFLKKARNRVSQ